MAHYARVTKDGMVEEVVVVRSVSVDENDEQAVNVYLADCGMPGKWLRCSYNTRKGVHAHGGEPFRGTYPGAGMYYDEPLDIFVNSPRPSAGATFSMETYSWIETGE